MKKKNAKLDVELFESIHSAAVLVLERGRYRVTTHEGAPSERELVQFIGQAHAVGVRSRTKLTAAHFEAARELLVVGCFAVGTNNVDLRGATAAGVPVFNAPYASTRSVAELTLGFLLALSRRMVEKSHLAKGGRWVKDAAGSRELRGKTLGIIGYGHVGSQVSILAEALGMRVLFHDIADRQPLGNAHPVGTLEQLLPQCDFVTLHVPGGPGTDKLMGKRELELVKHGAFLVNTARGSVVDEKALVGALERGCLAGAALDVLAEEPSSPDARLDSPLRRFEQVILTPHVGGSTQEAQLRIGETVAQKMVRYLEEGATSGSVNFPQVELPRIKGTHRLIHVHHNVPGVLSGVNGILSGLGANIEAQFLMTNETIGYLLVDVDRTVSGKAVEQLAALRETIKARRLF